MRSSRLLMNELGSQLKVWELESGLCEGVSLVCWEVTMLERPDLGSLLPSQFEPHRLHRGKLQGTTGLYHQGVQSSTVQNVHVFLMGEVDGVQRTSKRVAHQSRLAAVLTQTAYKQATQQEKSHQMRSFAPSTVCVCTPVLGFEVVQA